MFKIKAPDGRNNISGKKVKQYRLAKKMSQYKLAAKIQAMGYDVDNHFIRRIEDVYKRQHPDCTVGPGITTGLPKGSRAIPPVGNFTPP